ncbi:hypothetical protein K492DRAFT_198250 [Lichtheimia hyalospora FSU 10163]|nr:hypothetical protein K492DRAFT_198250 [Lichtheimia hyalospora FSU 10163]
MVYTNTPPDGSSSNVTNNDKAMIQTRQPIALLDSHVRNQPLVSTDQTVPSSFPHHQIGYYEMENELCTGTEEHSHYLSANGYHSFMHAQGHGNIEQQVQCQQFDITNNGGLFSPPSSTLLTSSSHFDTVNPSTASTYHDYQQLDPSVFPDATTFSNYVSLPSSVGINKSDSDLLNTCSETADQVNGSYGLLTPPPATDIFHSLHHFSSYDSVTAPSTTSGDNICETPSSYFQPVSGGSPCTTTITSNNKCNKRSSRPVANIPLDPQRPHLCFECPNIQSFKRKQDLTRHQKGVHGPKVDECIDCKSLFSRKDSMNRHRKTACKGAIKKRHMKAGTRLSGNNNPHVDFL